MLGVVGQVHRSHTATSAPACAMHMGGHAVPRACRRGARHVCRMCQKGDALPAIHRYGTVQASHRRLGMPLCLEAAAQGHPLSHHTVVEPGVVRNHGIGRDLIHWVTITRWMSTVGGSRLTCRKPRQPVRSATPQAHAADQMWPRLHDWL